MTVAQTSSYTNLERLLASSEWNSLITQLMDYAKTTSTRSAAGAALDVSVIFPT
jgi:hypothetical protein